MAIVWTKYWAGTDDGTILKGIDIRNIQDDLANTVQPSDIGSTVQAADDDLTNLRSPENVSTLNLVVNGAFDVFTSSPTPDNWTVEGGGTEAQETTDVRIGANAYSITSDADGSASRQNIYATISATENSFWRGKEVTLSTLVYATAASNARIQIDDGITTSESAYHTGTTGWELLTVSHTLSGTATKLDVVLMVDGNTLEAIFDGVRFNHGGSTWQYSRSQNDNFAVSTFDVVHLLERVAGPTTVANSGAIYTKEVGGQSELFYREESTGTEVQLTNSGSVYGGGVPENIQSFIINGTWTKPAGVSTVYVKVWGAGGVGGTGGVAPVAGGGGGGGGYSEGLIAVTGNVTVTVGTTTGATSSFAGTTTIQATGGGTGLGDGAGTPGAGGVGSNGTVNLTGSNGTVGASASGDGGDGGSSPMGGGGGGGGVSSKVGGVGCIPGGGGGGGASGATTPGGLFGKGLVIVYY